MPSTLLISRKVITEFSARIDAILAAAPRKLELLPFAADSQLTPEQINNIDAAYFSRDIWEGTEKSVLSPAAQAFWNVIDHAPNVKWMAVYSAGTDQKRYQDVMQRGVRLTTSAGAQSESVGLACAAGILALARGIPHWLAAQQRREWSPLRGKDVPPDIPGQTAVIVGTGYIGTVIARVLRAAGMKTIGIRRNLIDARRLALMKPGAGIANIARGEIIDEAALADALKHKRLRHAYLDVFHTEPLPTASPLWDLPNVLISPHNAGASTGTHARGVEIFLRNLEKYLGGRGLENEASVN